MTNPYFIVRSLCPACGSNSLKSLYQNPMDKPPIKDYIEEIYSTQGGVEFEYLTGVDYVLKECLACGMIFQQQAPDKELMNRLYEHWIEPEKTRVIRQKICWEEGYYTKFAQELMQINAYFNKPPETLKVFDFGMGWGEWILMAKAFGFETSGLELSEKQAEFNRSCGIKTISREEIPGSNFDFINTEQVFEHLVTPLEALKHLKTGLSPSGIIKISVPTAVNIKKRLKRMDWSLPKSSKYSLSLVAPLEHINFYRRKSLLRMAYLAGLKEIFIPMRLQYRYATDWHGIKQTAKNILLPAYRNILKKQNCLFFSQHNY